MDLIKRKAIEYTERHVDIDVCDEWKIFLGSYMMFFEIYLYSLLTYIILWS